MKCPPLAPVLYVWSQLVILLWEVLESLGGDIYLEEAGPCGQALRVIYPWCLLSHFLLPVSLEMSSSPLPQAPATGYNVFSLGHGPKNCRWNPQKPPNKRNLYFLSLFLLGIFSSP